MWRQIIGLGCAGLLVSVALYPVRAAEKPTGEEARKFINYYYHGHNEAPLLSQIKFCREIEKETDAGSECRQALSSAVKDQPAYVWMEFVVPRGNKGDIIVQFEQGGVTRLTREFSLEEAFPFRVYQKFSLNRPGQWTIKVLNDRAGAIQKLRETTLLVVDAQG